MYPSLVIKQYYGNSWRKINKLVRVMKTSVFIPLVHTIRFYVLQLIKTKI